MTDLQDVTPSPKLPPDIKWELVQLYDSYREFQHYCSFYCQSTSVMLHRFAHDLDADCTEGIERVAQMVVDKAEAIDVRLKQFMDKI